MIATRRFLVIAAVAVVLALLAGPVAADWNAGVDLYHQGRFAEAVEQFQAVVKSNPDWPGGYLMLGRCQLALDQHGDALDNLRKAAELAPGEAAAAANHLSEAANWYAAAVQERPQEPVARYRFASTLAALDRSDEAIDQLRAALGAAPDAGLAARIHGQLGRLLACRVELPEAARHYRAAGDDSRAARIDELAERYDEAVARLASLRNDSSELAGMEGELEALGDAEGMAAVAGRRKVMGREIAAIEDNLSEVYAALCQ
jgi:tetratricopeptide (TPR) repeat protein